MDKVERLFKDRSESSTDCDRLVKQVKDILVGDKLVHILFGHGNNGKTALLCIFKNIFKDKAFHLPFESLCSSELDNSYIPYIIDSEYIIIIGNEHDSINPDIIKKLSTGFVCQYRKPYTNNWSQVSIKPKKIIIETITNPVDSVFTKNNELQSITNIINFNKVIENQDWQFFDDVSNNHYNDVYNYLINY